MWVRRKSELGGNFTLSCLSNASRLSRHCSRPLSVSSGSRMSCPLSEMLWKPCPCLITCRSGGTVDRLVPVPCHVRCQWRVGVLVTAGEGF